MPLSPGARARRAACGDARPTRAEDLLATDVEHPALVLGLSETGLGVVRALGRSGIPVVGFDRKRRIGARSRFVNAGCCPDPRTDESGFVGHLLAFSRAQRARPVLLVTSDAFLGAVARAWPQLQDSFELLGPSPDVVALAVDKRRLHQRCLDLGIAVPRSVHAAGIGDLESAVPALSFPVFVKSNSASGRRAAFPPPAKGAVATDAGELRRIVGEATAGGADVIIQEVVEGPDRNCGKYCACVGADGRMLLEFTLQKVRTYPAHYGVGSCCVSGADPEMAALGRRVFNALGYRGVGSIEFKRDDRDGRLTLIEVNARYWQQVALATACGMNFPVMHYLEATGQAPEPVADFRPGVTWISLGIDAASCLQYRREGALTWSQWRNSLRGPVVVSEAEWPDVWPLLGGGRPWQTGARWAKLLAGFLARSTR